MERKQKRISFLKRALLFFIVGGILSLAISVSLEIFLTEKTISEIKKSEKERIRTALPSLIKLYGQNIKNMLNSFGMWNEMYEKVKEKDILWIKEMMGEDPMVTSQFEIYGVYGEDGEPIYLNKVAMSEKEVTTIISTLKKMFKHGETTYPLTFFIKDFRGDVYLTGVIPVSDNKGFLKSYAFIYFGYKIDEDFVENLGKILAVSVKISWSRGIDNSTVIYTYPLENINGKVEGHLKIMEGSLLQKLLFSINETFMAVSGVLVVSFIAIFSFITKNTFNFLKETLVTIEKTLHELSAGNLNALGNLKKLSNRNDEIGFLVEDIVKIGDKLSQSLLTDPLTGAYNRLFFTKKLNEEIERAKRDNKPLTLALIDLDDFKKINDSFGHKAGDFALKRFVETAKSSIRKIDTIARVGGEEFAIIFPSSDTANAFKIVERIRNNLKPVEIDGKRKIDLTFSCGITSFKGKDNIDTIYHRADIALYRAKKKGKNRIEIEE